MRTKTIIEMLTMLSSIYYFSKDSEMVERLKEMAGQHFNKDASGAQVDGDGHEGEFIDELIQKTKQAKEELEKKIEEMVVIFYKKVNIAHLDEIKGLNEKLEKADMAIALLEARINHLESKE